MPDGFREDSRLVTVWIDWPGLGDLGIFAKRGGGDADSEESKFPPGGGQKEIALGGRQTVDNVTADKLVTPAELPKRNALLDARGKARMVVSDVFIDEDDNPVETGMTWTGKYKKFTYPDADSTSNDPALLQLEMTAEDVTA